MGFDTVLSTTYSSNMSSKRVTDSFKLKVSKCSEEVNKNLQNARVEQENDPHFNEKQNEETVLKESGLFHSPKHHAFPKTRTGYQYHCVSNIGSKIYDGYITMKGT